MPEWLWIVLGVIGYFIGAGAVIGLTGGDDIEDIYAAAFWPLYAVMAVGIWIGEMLGALR